MHSLFLGLGSNLGDKQHYIELAYKEINKRIGKVISQSDFYISRPDGFYSDNDFMNTVCKVETVLSPFQVLEEIFSIEEYIGRTSKSINGEYTDRVIDIDILLYDNIIIETEYLVVPHPRFHFRSFVLVPFADISPNIIHPILKKTIIELKDELGAD